MIIFVVDANLDVSAPFKLVTRVQIIVEKPGVKRKIGFLKDERIKNVFVLICIV